MDAHGYLPTLPPRHPRWPEALRWALFCTVMVAWVSAWVSPADAETRQPVAVSAASRPAIARSDASTRTARLPGAASARSRNLSPRTLAGLRSHHESKRPVDVTASAARVEASAGATPVHVERPQWKAPPKPQWTVDAHGRPSDRVNGYMAGSLDEIRSVFQKAGWTEGDIPSFASNARFVGAVVRSQTVKAANAVTKNRFGWKTPKADRQIQEMPISAQTHEGTLQAVAFQKENNPFGGRHHFRIFDTGAVHEDGRTVWAVAASRDTKVVFSIKDWRRFFLSHAVERNADHERDLVSLDALKTGQLKAATVHQGPSDVRGAKGIYSKDGDAFFLVVRPAPQAL